MIIAKIRLSAGNAGWYDPLSNTHLTIGRPYADIRAGVNLTGIKKGLKYKTITLVSGSLDEDKIIAQTEKQSHDEVIQVSTIQEKKIVQDINAEQQEEVLESTGTALAAQEAEGNAVENETSEEAPAKKTKKASKSKK